MSKPGVMFYFDIRPCIKRLDTTEKGQLFEAILDYGEYGTTPNFDGAIGVAWDFIQQKLDKDSDRYDKQVEQKQYAVFSRELKKRGCLPVSFDDWKCLSDTEKERLISNDNERYPTPTTTPTTTPTPTTTNIESIVADKPPTRTRFIQPTAEDVKQYCFENGIKNVDADRFVSYYESNGWMVGRNKMKDWKAAVRNWASKENEKPQKPSGFTGVDPFPKVRSL